MAIKTINGEPITVDTSQIDDASVTLAKLAPEVTFENDISELRESVVKHSVIPSVQWERGFISADGEMMASQVRRWRMAASTSYDQDIEIHADEGYKILLCFYDEGDNFRIRSQISTRYAVPAGKRFRVLAYSDNDQYEDANAHVRFSGVGYVAEMAQIYTGGRYSAEFVSILRTGEVSAYGEYTTSPDYKVATIDIFTLEDETLVTPKTGYTVKVSYYSDGNEFEKSSRHLSESIKLEPGKYRFTISSKPDVTTAIADVVEFSRAVTLKNLKYSDDESMIPSPTGQQQLLISDSEGSGWELFDCFGHADKMLLGSYDGALAWLDFGPPVDYVQNVGDLLVAGQYREWNALSPGTNGQALTISNGFPTWADIPQELPAAVANDVVVGGSGSWVALHKPDEPSNLIFNGSAVNWEKSSEANILKNTTERGALGSVDDAWPSALTGLTVYGNSTQDGTPTPDAPVAIKSVAGAGVVVTVENQLKPVPGTYSHETFNMTAVVDDNGTITVNCDERSRTYSVTVPLQFPYYQIPGLWWHLRNNQSFGNSATINSISISSVNRIMQISSFSGSSVLVLSFKAGDAISDLTLQPSIEATNAVTDWVAPVSNTLTPLTLTDSNGVTHELRSLPDGTCDTLEVMADGSGVLTERVGVRTFDGTENWTANPTLTAFYRSLEAIDSSANTLSSSQILSDLFSAEQSQSAFSAGNVRITKNSANTQYVIYFGMTGFEDAAGFKAWLTENPTTVYWPAFTPATYTIPAINMPSLPATVSNAWVSATDGDGAAIACDSAVSYRQDVNVVVGKLASRISELENN